MSVKSGRPTLHDVAQAAGVGTTTVSRVINGGYYVAPEMMARIQKVIAELGYQPNQAARSLKNERSRTIGLIVPSITDPFFAHFAGIAESIARKQDYVVILLTSQDKAQVEVDDLQIFERHRVDGLLLVPPRSKSKPLLDNLNRLSVPVVAIDRPIANRNYSSVLCDNNVASQHAVRHLIEHGRKRILCLGGDSSLYTIRERAKGYASMIASHGLESLVEMGASDFESAERIISQYMTKGSGIDAIFGLYNQSTIHAYQVLQSKHIDIPRQVSIVGFDDFALASALRPSVTVVQQAVNELARTATQLLFDHMTGEITSPQQIEISATLTIRQSCGCPATD